MQHNTSGRDGVREGLLAIPSPTHTGTQTQTCAALPLTRQSNIHSSRPHITVYNDWALGRHKVRFQGSVTSE
ncbi:hypothetical protein E2C01_028250 [Portunus trituberculatus]|uniref:Uncharacterized protein n=1 Tax=Portunus trituberculatus TaxID=210409 RepID=A0A5B7ENJ5_PORTR|nr:hypothetical protein [Portunus trituberculatus]